MLHWPRQLKALLIIITACTVFLVGVTARADDDVEFFEKKIRPVLVERCFKCHSAISPKPKGGLRLDRRAALLDGGESGAAIVTGKPDESLLVKAIAWSSWATL